MKLMKIISINELIHMKSYIQKKNKIWHSIAHKGWYAIEQNNQPTNQPNFIHSMTNLVSG